jgi:hypothetical protein
MKFSLTAFPSLLVPVLFYAIGALTGGASFVAGLQTSLMAIELPSASVWSVSWGDLIVGVGLIFMFIDLLKATGTGTATLFNHALSTLLLVVAIVLFLMAAPFGTSVFFLLLFMMLLDVVAGFTITIIGARRDFSSVG